MSKQRDLALELLKLLEVKLRPIPGALSYDVSFSVQERDYWADVCAKARADKPNPLGLGKVRGGQTKRAERLAEAALVHRYVRDGMPKHKAYELVGAQSHRDGSKRGAVEKVYEEFEGELIAADRIYSALAGGSTPEAADIATVLGEKAEGK